MFGTENPASDDPELMPGWEVERSKAWSTEQPTAAFPKSSIMRSAIDIDESTIPILMAEVIPKM